MTTTEFRLELTKHVIELVDKAKTEADLRGGVMCAKLANKAAELFRAEKLGLNDNPLNYDSKDEAEIYVLLRQLERRITDLNQVLKPYKKAEFDICLLGMKHYLSRLEIHLRGITFTKDK